MKHEGQQRTPVTSDQATSSHEYTIFHFCQFVEYYTQFSADPHNTAAVCEHHAEEIRISPQEVNRETILMLIATMLTAVDHVERKWAEELAARKSLEQRLWKNRLSAWRRQWTRWRWKYALRKKNMTTMS